MKHYISTETVVMLVIYDCNENMDNRPKKLNNQAIENSDCAMTDNEVVVDPLDVLLGRGKSNETHVGNRKFRSKLFVKN